MSRRQLTKFEKGQILAFKEEGESMREISRRLGFNESTIRRFLKKYQESGVLERKSGSGRKRCTTLRIDHHIKRTTLRNRFVTAPQVRRDIVETTGIDISVTTVQRRLNEAGLFAYRTAKKKHFLRLG